MLVSFMLDSKDGFFDVTDDSNFKLLHLQSVFVPTYLFMQSQHIGTSKDVCIPIIMKA